LPLLSETCVQFKKLRVIPEPTLSDAFHATCRARLLSCLADLTSQTKITSSDKSPHSIGRASNGELWISKVLSTISALEKDKKHVHLLEGMDEVESALRTKARSVLHSLAQPEDNPQGDKIGAELLLAATLLHRYCSMGNGGAEQDGVLEVSELFVTPIHG
jgi:DNA polymerase phi